MQENYSRRDQEPKEKMLSLVVENKIMVVYANEIQFRTSVDTGAQSRYDQSQSSLTSSNQSHQCKPCKMRKKADSHAAKHHVQEN